MDLAEELRKLEELHRSGALTDEEFARAKAALLNGPPGADNAALREEVAQLRRENAVARLDHDWERQRERYLVTGRYGRRYLPTPGISILTGAAVVGFGVLWTVLAYNMGMAVGGGFGCFPFFGVLFVVFGLLVSISSYSKAVRYRRAYDAYLRRRDELLAGDATGPETDEPRAG
jgi:hypothetical protein